MIDVIFILLGYGVLMVACSGVDHVIKKWKQERGK